MARNQFDETLPVPLHGRALPVRRVGILARMFATSDDREMMEIERKTTLAIARVENAVVVEKAKIKADAELQIFEEQATAAVAVAKHRINTQVRNKKIMADVAGDIDLGIDVEDVLKELSHLELDPIEEIRMKRRARKTVRHGRYEYRQRR